MSAWARQALDHQAVPRLDTLEACRAAWAARNPEALQSGLRLCVHAGGMPAWLAEACLDLLKLRPVVRRLWTPYRQDLIDYDRYITVRAARRRGLTWAQAYGSASEALLHGPSFGSPAAMKKSYHIVRNRARRTPARYALGWTPSESGDRRSSEK